MTTIHSRRDFRVASYAHGTAEAFVCSNESLIEEYLAWKRSYSKTAHIAYRPWVIRFQQFANKPPELLRHTDYVLFAASLADRYASKAITFALAVVQNYLRYYAEQERLNFPMYLIRVPRSVSQTHPAISEENYRQLISSMNAVSPRPYRDLAIIHLLHDTGLRIGELLSLEIDDIEEDKSAVVRTEKTTGFRRVYWNADTEEVLHAHLVARVNHGPKTSPHLFTVSRLGISFPLSSRSVERMLKKYLKRAGLSPEFCPHSFRHSFIHRLAKLGVPDAIIAQLVGHSSPNSIAHYTKLSRPELKEIAHKQLGICLDASAAIAA